MMRHILLLVFFASAHVWSAAQKGASIAFEKCISLRQAGGAVISPDGKHVLYSVTTTDWATNGYDTEIWLSRNGAAPFRLTNTNKGSSTAASFSPDSKLITFVADRGDKRQLYAMLLEGGEAFVLTNEENGIEGYDWSPDGKQLAISKLEPESKTDKAMKERYGAFGEEGTEYRMTHLWVMNVHLDSIAMAGLLPCYSQKKDSTNTADKLPCYKMPQARQITKGNFTVRGFSWRPGGKHIAFTMQPDPLINTSVKADVAMVEVATGKLDTLVRNASSDFFETWNPDGTQFVYNTFLNDTTTFFYKNNRFMVMDMATRKSTEIATSIDEDKQLMDWNSRGIFMSALKKMKAGLYQVDPKTGAATELNTGMDVPGRCSFSEDGSRVAITGRNFDQLSEVWIGKTGNAPAKLTDMTGQLKGWNLPKNEIVSWKSNDGATIEGVLIKPSDFNPAKKYPLLVLIHGGPTGIDRPEPAPSYVYPVVQWCEKGALVLRVNYRGSAGYGEKFRELNVRNLGVGDMWDVMSGVEYLEKQGFVDSDKMGCMGWSQGGYISAFLTTNTNRFKAISVGAGISNWVTYYVNTDITPFTRQYLNATPWNDMEVYLKTSPMTNINKASTPTLIQHGEFDKRVPIPNAYELYRGLQDRKIPSKLIVYKGFGHGINKPKERLAAIWHNWQWFNHYVWGEPMAEMPAE
jgi:dipeptidyl aminopeptidase/acylaminoacyl peptidase